MSSSRFSESGWWAFSSAVVATAFLSVSPAAAGDSPWTIAAKVGQASVEGDFGPALSAWRVDDDDTAAAIEVGYRLHRFFGLQAGYHDLGSYAAIDLPCPPETICPLPFEQPRIVPDTPTGADFTGVSLAAVPRWPVTERFSVYAKAGVLAWESDLAWPVAPQGDEPSGEDLIGGVGALYAFPSGVGLQLEAETTDLYDQVSLGSSWRF